MISSLETYSIYRSLNLHFNNEAYDAIKYRFKVKVNSSKFQCHKDRYEFEKTARKYLNRNDVIKYFVGNIIEGLNYVRDFHEDNYLKYRARIQTARRNFQIDLNKILDIDRNFNDVLLKADKDSIIMMLVREEIQLESVVILNKILNFIPKAKDRNDDPLGVNKVYYNKVLKYSPFVPCKVENFRKIAKDTISFRGN